MGEQATFGAELRRRRQQAGMSLAELAGRIHYSKGYLSKVETGRVAVNAAFAALCEAELGAVGTLEPLLPKEPERRRTRPDIRPAGLPPAVSSFVGRADELLRVRRALDADGGVCAVSGLGGVGKTELAVRCAHRLEPGFADGCLFIDLGGPGEHAVEPGAVLDRLLRTLGVPAEAIPADPDDRGTMYRSRLRGRSVLLVLDNAVNTAQVRPLLPAEPKCRVLITSRSRLAALDDAEHVSLSELTTGAASELFSTLTGIAVGEPVARIVDRCGRLPLAVRIGAARLRSHPAWDVDELDRRLATEQARLAELDDGERSVSAVFELSARQLPADQFRMLGLLALNPGTDIATESAGALCGVDAREADRLLDRLHDVHLVEQPAADRYAFHDLVRTFATDSVLRRLPTAEHTSAFRRLASFAVRNAEHADRLLTPHRYRPTVGYPENAPAPVWLTGEEDALRWFETEWPNLVALCRAAGERGEHDQCWRLAFFLRSFFFLTKLWDPWLETHRYARESAATAGDRWALATTTANLGVGLIDHGDLDGASTCYREALALYREIGDGHGEHTVLAHQAWVAHYRGDHGDALRDLSSALKFYEATGNVRNAAITTRGIALVLTALGEPVRAEALARSTLAVFDDLGLPLDAAMALNCVGWASYTSGDLDEAGTAYRDAATRAETSGSAYEAARAYTGLGNIAWTRGFSAEAVALWNQADDTCETLNPLMAGEARVRHR
ncbi:ATP-binding protein [Prauserella cavernicola]|uniref:Helix-turn-helix domain-containing protein n=1 Tax=Prauserella cavernicola TaxID=2800127 RepID=A0A934QSN8_9PSEU|nr:XRE family transcriptional regulator [Prauserella cavernicola]MBK1785508.1 helix-turn-helix domain-containing protein [Prauserella cavernicola]